MSELPVSLWQLRVERARERFIENTRDHQMAVLRDDGLYRHIRFERPSSSSYLYDLVTWPHHMAVTGDMGSLLFRRSGDMLSLFDSGGRSINPEYWAEKLVAPDSQGVEDFLEEAYLEHVQEMLYDWVRDLHIDPEDEFYTVEERDAAALEVTDLTVAVTRDLLPEHRTPTTNREAIELLEQFSFVGEFSGERYEVADAWELNFDRPTNQYLWLCWALTIGSHQFRSRRT